MSEPSEFQDVFDALVGREVIAAKRGYATMLTIDLGSARGSDDAGTAAPDYSIWTQTRSWSASAASGTSGTHRATADDDSPIDWLDGQRLRAAAFEAPWLRLVFNRGTAHFELRDDDEQIDIFLPEVVVIIRPSGLSFQPRRKHTQPVHDD